MFHRRRLSLHDEKATHADIALTFAEAGIVYEREKRLAVGDIIDFFLPDGGVGIEVKLRQSKTQIFRQLERYAEHEAITALVLVSATAMSLPRTIKDKPAFIVSLGRGWL